MKKMIRTRPVNWLLIAIAAVLILSISPVWAQEGEQNEKWSKWTLTPGLQMWTPLVATDAGEANMQPMIGGVIKIHRKFTDVLGASVRVAYGFNDVEVASGNRTPTALGLGLGIDFYKSIGKQALWYNTYGVGYVRTTNEQEGKANPSMWGVGAYFVTGFDVTFWNSLGAWMDWGCQVVGPSKADSVPGGKVSVWHINPLGAGGLRVSF